MTAVLPCHSPSCASRRLGRGRSRAITTEHRPHLATQPGPPPGRLSSACWPASHLVGTGRRRRPHRRVTRDADSMARVLLQHHATERELLWPALFLRAAGRPARRRARGDQHLDHPHRVARPHPARPLHRRPAVGGGGDSARPRRLRPRLHPAGGRRRRGDPRGGGAISCRCCRSTCRTASGRRSPGPRRRRCSGREQMGLVLGLALEDACALDRARLLAGPLPLSPPAWLWRTLRAPRLPRGRRPAPSAALPPLLEGSSRRGRGQEPGAGTTPRVRPSPAPRSLSTRWGTTLYADRAHINGLRGRSSGAGGSPAPVLGAPPRSGHDGPACGGCPRGACRRCGS